MRKLLPFLAVSVLSLGARELIEQPTTTAQPKTAAPTPAPHYLANFADGSGTGYIAAAPPLDAKDMQGLDVFASGSQQLGKVTKVNTSPDGKIKMSRSNRRDFWGCSRQ